MGIILDEVIQISSDETDDGSVPLHCQGLKGSGLVPSRSKPASRSFAVVLEAGCVQWHSRCSRHPLLSGLFHNEIYSKVACASGEDVVGRIYSDSCLNMSLLG